MSIEARDALPMGPMQTKDGNAPPVEQTRIEDRNAPPVELEDGNAPPMELMQVPPHSGTGKGIILIHVYISALLSSIIIGSIKVKPEISDKLLVLNQEYSDMLVVVQTTRLSRRNLSRLKLFLSNYCEEQSLKVCLSTEEIVEQLKVKLKIHIFNIDTLDACKKYFSTDGLSRSIQQYKEHLNTFLSTNSVKEFRSALQTDPITARLDDAEPRLTLKLDETTSDDTLMNLRKLVYHLFGPTSKALVIIDIHTGCICVSWIVPVSLVSTLRAKAQQLSSEYLASKGVLELVIGLRIVPNEGL